MFSTKRLYYYQDSKVTNQCLFLDDEVIYMGDEDSFVVTDAKPVTKYSFRLRYTTEGDESPFSIPVQVETPESGKHWAFCLGNFQIKRPMNFVVLIRTTNQIFS